jgi:hypothetical protein
MQLFGDDLLLPQNYDAVLVWQQNPLAAASALDLFLLVGGCVVVLLVAISVLAALKAVVRSDARAQSAA